jgi:hypothetical protein
MEEQGEVKKVLCAQFQPIRSLARAPGRGDTAVLLRFALANIQNLGISNPTEEQT